MTSKFEGLAAGLRQKPVLSPEPVEEAAPPSPAPPLPAKTPRVEAPPAKRGRPKGGKRTDPDYTQVTAYIEEAVHMAVKKALIDAKGQDFSDLVNELLKKWVKSRT